MVRLRTVETVQEKGPDLTRTPAPFFTIKTGIDNVRGRLEGAMTHGKGAVSVELNDEYVQISTAKLQTPNRISIRNNTEREACISTLRDIDDCIRMAEDLPFRFKGAFAADLKKDFLRVCAQGNESRNGFGSMTASLFLQEVQQLARGRENIFTKYVGAALNELNKKAYGTPLWDAAYKFGGECAALMGKPDATISDWVMAMQKLQTLLQQAHDLEKEELVSLVAADDDAIELTLGQ